MSFSADILTLLLAMMPGQISSPSDPVCMGGHAPALLEGGFSGSTDCEQDSLSFEPVGELHAFGRKFSVFVNRYRLKPACEECAVRGGQRIIVMETGRYVGQYKADFTDVSIQDNRLNFVRTDDPNAEPVIVAFTSAGPPEWQWDGAEVLQFFK